MRCSRTARRPEWSCAEPGAAFGEQLAQDGAVTARFILAVTADGKVGLQREGGEQVEQMCGFGLLHLGAKLPHKGLPPTRIVAGAQRKGDQIRCGRQRGQPNVVEIAPGEIGFGNAARRTADRADAEPLIGLARRSEADDGNGHVDRVQGAGHKGAGPRQEDEPGSQE
jgi:hypothetical protein